MVVKEPFAETVASPLYCDIIAKCITKDLEAHGGLERHTSSQAQDDEEYDNKSVEADKNHS